MTFYPIDEYTLVDYQKSRKEGKKYDAVLVSRQGMIKYVPFGDINYQHYKDSTPNKLYSYLDHNDKKRRENYRSRHLKDIKPGYYSPGFFSYYKLW